LAATTPFLVDRGRSRACVTAALNKLAANLGTALTAVHSAALSAKSDDSG